MADKQTAWTAIQASTAAIAAIVSIIAAAGSITYCDTGRTERLEAYVGRQATLIRQLERRITELEHPEGRPGPFRSPGRK